MELLEVNHLCKTYGSGETAVHALKDVSFSVPKGEYVAVREMRKHVGWYLKGVPGAAAFRGRINQINSAEELRKAIQEI